jgi:hypothetical protein
MRPLEQALQEHELIVLRVIGEWWDLDLTGSNKTACVKTLAKALPQLDVAEEIAALPPEEAAAVQALLAQGGRLPVATFIRQFGDVRQMGPAALERDEPWYDPESVAESLWYRGFLFRGFAEVEGIPHEFYYLPHEFVAQFPAPATADPVVASTAVAALPTAEPPESYTAAPTDLVDDVTTILSFVQRGRRDWLRTPHLRPYLQYRGGGEPSRIRMANELVEFMGWVRKTEEGYKTMRSAVDWLQKNREQQLRELADGWRQSDFKELTQIAGLQFERLTGESEPAVARQVVLKALVASEAWFDTAALATHIKATDPDFLRPHGNYDTWYIREEATQKFLAGFESWEKVEGEMITLVVLGPLHWLGMVEVSGRLYRLTPRGVAWLNQKPIPAQEDVPVPILIQPDASLLVPFNADRYQRFQVGRFADLAPVQEHKPYHYQITPLSLEEAQAQGINPERVVEFLNKVSGRPVPASTKRAVERWGEKGTEARVEPVLILRVKEEGILEKLRQHPKTRPFMGESIGPLAVVVQASQLAELCAQAAQLGLLLEVSG